MTITKKWTIGLAAAFVALLVLQAPAEAVTAARVNVPFDFVVSGKVRAAGTYLVRNDRIQGLIDFIGNDGNGFSVMTAPIGARRADLKPCLQFKKTGNDHVLAMVYLPGYENGFLLPGAQKLKGETLELPIQR